MKAGDLVWCGTVLEVKDNPADKGNRLLNTPRKIALILPFDGGPERWAFVDTLKRRKAQKIWERTREQIGPKHLNPIEK